ncbi:hypothetical protein M0802_004355 [Mischocyttarus mexicanus]|nr:hypothetical protein M0802_004355 [Mischocyttarus mexicanus]
MAAAERAPIGDGKAGYLSGGWWFTNGPRKVLSFSLKFNFAESCFFLNGTKSINDENEDEDEDENDDDDDEGFVLFCPVRKRKERNQGIEEHASKKPALHLYRPLITPKFYDPPRSVLFCSVICLLKPRRNSVPINHLAHGPAIRLLEEGVIILPDSCDARPPWVQYWTLSPFTFVQVVHENFLWCFTVVETIAAPTHNDLAFLQDQGRGSCLWQLSTPPVTHNSASRPSVHPSIRPSVRIRTVVAHRWEDDHREKVWFASKVRPTSVILQTPLGPAPQNIEELKTKMKRVCRGGDREGGDVVGDGGGEGDDGGGGWLVCARSQLSICLQVKERKNAL